MSALFAGKNNNPSSRMKITNLTRQTVLADSAELANRSATRNKGLLGRTSLAAGGGLWIVPCESVHTFFMKFPIDLVYIDRQKIVKKVRTGVGPWRISGCISAHSVIELPVGTVSRTQTVSGDKLECLPAESTQDAENTILLP